MQCSCQRRDNPVASTSTSRKSTSSRPYQQIVFDSKTTGNTRLEWISSTTTTHTSPDKTKSRVRSHVMQRFRAQQALGQHAPPSNRAGVFADYDPRIEYYFTCRMCGRLNTEGCRETTTERDVEGHLREFTMRCESLYLNVKRGWQDLTFCWDSSTYRLHIRIRAALRIPLSPFCTNSLIRALTNLNSSTGIRLYPKSRPQNRPWFGAVLPSLHNLQRRCLKCTLELGGDSPNSHQRRQQQSTRLGSHGCILPSQSPGYSDREPESG